MSLDMDSLCGGLERFELVSSPNTRAIADLIRLALQFGELMTQVSDMELDGEDLKAFVSTLETGPYLPVLFDNIARVELNQPVTALRYIAKLIASASPHNAAFDGSTSHTNAIRAELAAETVVRFLRDNAALSSQAGFDASEMKSRIAQQCKMINAVLSQTSILEEDTKLTITYGDLCTWYFLLTAHEQYGPLFLASFPHLSKYFEALAKNAAISAFAAARKSRTTGTATAAAAITTSITAAAASKKGSTSITCLVTGGNGYIASWVVKLLLQRGHRVHATVRSLEDRSKFDHLLGLDGAAERLTLFAAALSDPESFVKPMEGVSVVIHCASPYPYSAVSDPEAEIIRPAVEGTQNVIRCAIRSPTVKKFVLTSSVAAVYVSRKPADHFYSEDDWSDLEYIREQKQYYAESKLLAEQEAWRIIKEEVPSGRRLALCTICPTQTIGPVLQPHLNTSCRNILDFMDGSKSTIPNKCKCFVDVRDVALAHVLSAEDDRAHGRYLMIATSIAWRTVVDILKSVLPPARCPKDLEAGPVPYPQAISSIRRAHDLGISFTPIESSLRDCALSLYAHGYLDAILTPVGDHRQPAEPAQP